MYGQFPVNSRFPVLFLSQLPITGSVKLRLFFTVYTTFCTPTCAFHKKKKTRDKKLPKFDILPLKVCFQPFRNESKNSFLKILPSLQILKNFSLQF